MNINAINAAIEDLEASETAVNTVQELAALYIVKDYMENPEKGANLRVEREINDILPAYKKYCVIKRRFQVGEVQIEAINTAMKVLCKELGDLLCALYSGTNSDEERTAMITMLSKSIKTLQECS